MGPYKTKALVYFNEFQDTIRCLGSGAISEKIFIYFFFKSLMLHNSSYCLKYMCETVNVSKNNALGAGKGSIW